MSAVARERFTLRQDARRKLPFVILRQVADEDFLPGPTFWVNAGEVAAFATRADATLFMRAKNPAPAPSEEER